MNERMKHKQAHYDTVNVAIYSLLYINTSPLAPFDMMSYATSDHVIQYGIM